ncbi:B'ETA, partial [Symbiodinium microadriaticum]
MEICCHGRALQARDHLRKKLRQVKLSQGPCAGSFDLSEFSNMGMLASAAKWVVTDADLRARESFQFGHRQLPDRCSQVALHEDDESAAVRLWDMLGQGRTRRLLNFGAGSWSDPLWAVALQRNATGLFVDPVGPPKEFLPRAGIRFVSDFVRPDNIRKLLRGAGFRGRPGSPMPIDFMKVDVDSCDCVLASIALRFVRPSVIIMELNWSLPPPLRFVRQCHADWSRKWSSWSSVGFPLSTHGCSLSGALGELAQFGYSLFRLAGKLNAFFVHRDVADLLGGADVDEVFCFNQVWQDNSIIRYLHWKLSHDWRTACFNQQGFRSDVMKLIQTVKRRMGNDDKKSSTTRTGATGSGSGNSSGSGGDLAAKSKATPTYSSGNRAATAKPATESSNFAAIPKLREAPPQERTDLFRKKMEVCSVVFDFHNDNNQKEKEAKRQTLLEIVEYVNNTRNCFNEALMQLGCSLE